MQNVVVTHPGKTLVDINTNSGDTAPLSGITITTGLAGLPPASPV